MSILIFVDQAQGKIKKASLEALSYGVELASRQGIAVHALVLGELSKEDVAQLGAFGAQHILHDANPIFNQFDAKAYTIAIAKAATQVSASTVVLSFNQNGKSIAGRIAVRLKAALISGAGQMPTENIFTKNVFSGKGIAHVSAKSESRVIAISPNSYPVSRRECSSELIAFNAEVSDSNRATILKEVKKQSGSISLSEAELVVSAGRGLKGPENWGMIEELAREMGAATACSRPVGDMHWRPHHEHVGQTGLTVRPNLYIAIGISGAIQHLAGVNSSKVIVVINTDKEAPFFKAADYGIIGDAFTVVPNLINAYKKYKSASH